MKVLVYGANGWIGGKFVTELQKQNIPYIIGKSRVNHVENLQEELTEHHPTHVLCTIGRTHGMIDGKEITTIDYLEYPGKLEENVRDNLFSPIALAILCKDMGIHLTYLGTGCIFTYNDSPDRPPFFEDENPTFFGSSYSIVKGFTDRLMHIYKDVSLNIRIRMPISYDRSPRNFIMKLLKYEKINSNANSMTVLEDFIPIIVDMMCKKHTGTIHAVNPGAITHNEVLTYYRDIVDPTFTWKNFTYDEQCSTLKCERSNCILDTKNMQDLYPDLLPIKDSLIKLFNTWKLKSV